MGGGARGWVKKVKGVSSTIYSYKSHRDVRYRIWNIGNKIVVSTGR